MSTLLCNYFYGNLERELLAQNACAGNESLLLRMVDDFLLLTTSPAGVSGRAFRQNVSTLDALLLFSVRL